jgi:hypothetical protein
LNIQREETQNVSRPKSPSLSSSLHIQQPEQISSSSDISTSNIVDISRSFSEPPSQPILTTYPVDKNKRCFRHQWFSQFKWLEYSIKLDLAYCYYCRHLNSGTYFNNRVRDVHLIYRFFFQNSLTIHFLSITIKLVFLFDFYLE